MNTTKHTLQVINENIYRSDSAPAPFTTAEGLEYPNHRSHLVAIVYPSEGFAPELFAAAPELLSALESLMPLVAGNWSEEIMAQIESARATITKAKGEQFSP